jgi:TRAP-type C4-dicarboxylate transport system substrate-binding protein
MYNTNNVSICQQHKEEHFMNSNTRKSLEKPIELLFHNIHEHGVEIADMWMKEVEKRTGGRVRFRKSSGEDREAIKAADLVRDVPAMGSRYPLLNLVQIPFIFPSSTVGSKVIAQLYAEFSELRDELSDVKVVGLGLGALMAIFSNKKWGPIRALENFKGARTRSLELIDGVIEALGGRPMHVGWFEMAPLLETGGLDAAVLGVLPAHIFKLADGAAPYCTLAGKKSITMHPMRMYMKWDTWNSLPPDIRKIIDEIGPAGSDCWFAVQSGRDADKHLREALEYIKQKGELIKVTAKELKRWRQLIDPHREATVSEVEAKGLLARRFFNRMIELVEEYSR